MTGKLDTLRLRDVLNFLSTHEGRAFLAPLERDTRELAIVRENDPLDFYRTDGQGRLVNPDGFKVDILEHCYDKQYKQGLYRALPMAVTSALSKAADQNGILPLEAVQSALGPYAADLAGQLAERLTRFTPSELPINTKYEGGDGPVIEKIARSLKTDWGRSRMKLLSLITRVLGGPETFKDWKIASLSHLFPTRPALYLELEENGAKRENHLISGKGYSRNIDVVYGMKADHWNVDPSLEEAQNNYAPGGTDDVRAKAVLDNLFMGLDPATCKEQFLLLDDGANLLVALHNHYPQFAKFCRVVEQTDHGIQRIEEELYAKGKPLLCPVINMARSWLKKLFEAPMIGEAILHSTETLLADIHPKLKLDRKECALFGLGAVNEQTVKALERRGFKRENIWVYDIDPQKILAAQALGLKTGIDLATGDDGTSEAARKKVLNHGALCISATGQTTMTPEDFDELPNEPIVVNGGSGKHELGMHLLGEWDRRVASLPDGRHFARLEARPEERSERQIEQFMNTALGQLELQDAMLRVRMPRTAAVLGYDEDGQRAIQRMLERGFKKKDIVVADANEAQRKQAERDGFRVVGRDAAIGGGTLVVANQENVLIAPADTAKLAKHAMMIFHAQPVYERGDDEAREAEHGARTPDERDRILGREEEYFRGYLVNNAAGRAGEGYRHRVLHTGSGNDVLVLRSGYVVNMETGIPPEYAQLILGMLLTAMIQATEESDPGLHDLKHQDFLKKQFVSILKKMGLSIDDPSFKGLKAAFT